ncbi:hypothetical protein L1987_65698 [Smallanthus sonchifolius]|uniref:Uncharacterized protein n=1 Tax=Smallanthus sonchifolius TaxID=185202 RepID=A0ACB9BV81_9ASTR|nr:hypothetical protein L1987_65698 [Smallanthus sonchifolius]
MTNSKRKYPASGNDAHPEKRLKKENEELKRSSGRKKTEVMVKNEEESQLAGDPIADNEARQRWPHRYQGKNKIGSTETPKGSEPPKECIQAKRHFTKAIIEGGISFKLGDDAYVQVIQGCSNLIDDKRIFLSEIRDDNPLDCLLEKLKIVRVPLDVDDAAKRAMLADGNYYYDMYHFQVTKTYRLQLYLCTDNETDGNESDSTVSSESNSSATVTKVSKVKEEIRMLDLYSGCGAMSTGLCLGANMADVNLVTVGLRWAVDLNEYACESLKLNHLETEVRNESAEDFLSLLKEWEKLCQSFSLIGGGDHMSVEKDETENEDEEEDDDLGDEVFEVEKVLSICYGDPKKIKKRGLYLKISWKNYGPAEDTWEPIDGLGDCQEKIKQLFISDCQEKIKQFVVDGFKSKLLPLPGDVDVICGGPPCQGISGFNRFRNKDNPLSDEKNKQLVVYMDIVECLKPRFALMENVVDIVKFAM